MVSNHLLTVQSRESRPRVAATFRVVSDDVVVRPPRRGARALILRVLQTHRDGAETGVRGRVRPLPRAERLTASLLSVGRSPTAPPRGHPGLARLSVDCHDNTTSEHADFARNVCPRTFGDSA